MSEDNQARFDFGPDLEKRLLSLSLYDIGFLAQASKYLEPFYFTSEPMQWMATTILDYFNNYRQPITIEAMAYQIKQQPRDKQLVLVTIARQIYDLRVSEDRYLKDALREFVQRNVFVRGWESIERAYRSGDAQRAYEVFDTVGEKIKQVDFSPPDRSFFFEDYESRQQKRASRDIQMTVDEFPTGIPQLDINMHGGLRRGEVGLLFGDAKIGKSIGLLHMAFACVRPRLGRVAVFILEDSRQKAEDRLDARFAEHNYYDLRENRLDPYIDKRLRHEYKKMEGWLVIEGMTDKWDYTILDIESRMRELESIGFVADLVVIDYGDLLEPRKAVEGKYAIQEAAFRDMKTLARKAYDGRGVALWTASQIARPRRQGRGPHPADVDPEFVWVGSDIADSYPKIRIADIAISMNQTIQEKEQGSMRLHVSHARDHESKITAMTRCDFTRMIFNTNAVNFQPQTNQAAQEQQGYG